MNDRAPGADTGGGVEAAGWRLSVESRVSPDVRQALEDGLTRHALPFTRVPGFEPLAMLARDGQGGLVGGAVGTINWNCLHVAARRGCTRAHLDTFSYQARPFYERLGYRVFGVLEDYPPGHRRCFLEKALDRPEGTS
jgi:hypothetical protein